MTKLRADDWVEVRSKAEILQTLDKKGQLDSLPFMPQMFEYCGKRFQVYKRAHKTCDTVNGITNGTGGRRLRSGVHLDLRCDGKAHGGCQAQCMLFWKEAWLKRPGADEPSLVPQSTSDAQQARGCSEEDVSNGTRAQDLSASSEPVYVCQATRLPAFTAPLYWWDVRQYAEDYTSGNTSVERLFRGALFLAFYHGTQAWRRKVGRLGRWLYDWMQSLWGGARYPRTRGQIPVGQPTPVANLNLQPGDLVRIKSHEEILKTIDTNYMNRGLYFDAEMVPYCGQVACVKARVSIFIDEKTGRMKKLKTPAVILDGVYCRSRYSNYRMFCPRSIYSWWREIWLEKVPARPQI